MRKRWWMIALAAMVGLAPAARADVKLPALFTDGVVLQQGMECPVWGWANDGEKVTVKFRGQQVSATANGGKWMVKLAKLTAGGPDTMIVAGNNTIEVKDVLVGEVWVASGQSNMQFALNNAYEAQRFIDAAANPKIHLFTVPNVKAQQPLDDVKSQWVPCTPETARRFSAVAYFFGRDLQKALNVPVGIIHTSWGGSPAEVWMSKRVLEADPEYKALYDAGQGAAARYQEQLAKFRENLPKIREENQAAIAEAQKKAQELVDAAKDKSDAEKAKADADGKKLVADARQRAARRAQAPRIGWVPAELYNGMIAPLIPFAIKGAIWYQGESNASRAFQYRRLFVDMIKNWRQDWGEGDFPFLCVQLAPFMAIKEEPSDSAWAELREAQWLATKTLPNVGMAVITDVGNPTNIHPIYKEPVGQRLALLARSIAYGEKIVCNGPTYDSMEVKGNQIILSFKSVGSGLMAEDGALKGFAICGADHKFRWAKAQIQGDKVVVSNDEIANPVAVRYGWADCPVVNLYNKEGLPATPFRTDDFPMITKK